MLAMHMANELMSPLTALATLAAGGLAVAIASVRSRRALAPEKLPLMGVLGAFVFAGQMINFTLPGMPGTSGHLGGGVLLAILLGPSAGVVVMTGVLVIQCLLFQDGGLLALGCNILNMGVVPSFLGWGLYRMILGPAAKAAAWRQYLAVWIACIMGLTAGATLVPIETMWGDRLAISTVDFLALMVGVHLLIGFVEGLITFAAIAYIRQARPEVLLLAPPTGAGSPRGVLSGKAFAASLIGTALLLAGVVSWFASLHPDGLEWAYQERKHDGGKTEPVKPLSDAIAAVETWQSKWSPLTDYGKREAPLGQSPAPKGEKTADEADAWGRPDGWKSLAGIVGTLLTLVLLYGLSRVFRRKPTQAD